MIDVAAERDALLNEIMAAGVIMPRDYYAALDTSELRRIAVRERPFKEKVDREGRLGALWDESGFVVVKR